MAPGQGKQSWKQKCVLTILESCEIEEFSTEISLLLKFGVVCGITGN